MANLKEIRVRIASVITTRQITSAMKMVSAAKLKKAQDAITQMRPYAVKLQDIMSNVSQTVNLSESNPYTRNEDKNKILIVLVTSNRGMCGAFNSNVIKSAYTLAQSQYKSALDSGNLSFLAVGKKGSDFFKSKKLPMVAQHNHILDNISFDATKELAEWLMAAFAQKKYDVIEIVYNQFKNAAVQIVTREQFLPLVPKQNDNKQANKDYIFEPTKEYIIEELIPKSLKIQLYKAIRDSYASEQGARMTAMHKATDNASDLIKDLTLNYNKARQASITNQILEVVSGAEALK